MRNHFYWIGSLLITLVLRVWLLISAAVPFNGDEAVVALMARHITQGARPLFFYGQAYMGSLDAFLIAGGFSILGEEIWVIRLVQILLYCGFLFTAWLLARRLIVDERGAGMAVLMMAVPPVMVTTYTAATLGGYGETLVFGNLILLTGYEVVYGRWREKAPAWIGLGLVGGLAFWTLGMSGVYLLPVGIVGLLNIRKLNPVHIVLAAAAFVIGSLPWWIENVKNNWSAVAFLLGQSELKLPLPSYVERFMGFFFLGVPTIFGFRRPWEGGYEPMWMVVTGILIMLGVAMYAVEIRRRKMADLRPGAGTLLFWMVVGFFVLFIATQFSIDSTGRYFLPVYPVVTILLGALAGRFEQNSRGVGWGLVAVVLLFNIAGVVRAANEPEGLTTQFAQITRFNNKSDSQLIEFLSENDLRYGYSNYWVTYRLAFLSDESLIYSPMLPYKEDLSYTPADNRYKLFNEIVASQPNPAYITTLHPALDSELVRQWGEMGITFDEHRIGPYHIFYNLSKNVRPDELDIYRER